MIYRWFIRPVLFLIDPEKVHHYVFALIKGILSIPLVPGMTRMIYQRSSPQLKRDLFGLEFPNPIGLAAGFDKDAKLYKELACFGFGFIEVGTVTPKAQEGNPKPRLFRLREDQSLINRMGFNNGGIKAMVERLNKREQGLIIGGNIGKNKITPNEEAINDYQECFEQLFDHVDYFVVNVSSPNTPNLRALQEKEPLTKLLQALQQLNKQKTSRKPILLKIAPDLSTDELDDIIDIIADTGIDGLIATNTTISRENLSTSSQKIAAIGAGGLSGKALTKKSTEVIAYLKEKSKNAFPIIAVGGIFSPEDAIEKLEAGADLLQVYTGFIYEGPGMIKKINRAIIKYYESKGN